MRAARRGPRARAPPAPRRDVLHTPTRGASTTLKPTSTVKRAVYDALLETNNGLIACRRVICNMCVLKLPSSAAVGAVGTGCKAHKCSGARK